MAGCRPHHLPAPTTHVPQGFAAPQTLQAARNEKSPKETGSQHSLPGEGQGRSDFKLEHQIIQWTQSKKNKIKQLGSPISPSAWPGPIPSLRTLASCFPAACLLHTGLGRGHELPVMLGATRASAGITHQVAPPRRVEVGFHVISDRGSEHGAVG